MEPIGPPIPGYENVLSNSSKRPGGVQNAGQFFTGYKNFLGQIQGMQLSGHMWLCIYTEIFLLITIYDSC